MKNDSNNLVYDMVILGNGIAAKSFLRLFTLDEKKTERKSQNFFVAQIYSEEITPSCSLRASVTVSLNGISADVSPLGNQMREGYFIFKEHFEKYHPAGVYPVERVVCASDEIENKKLIRRYSGTQEIEHKLLKHKLKGVTYPAYIINTPEYLSWIDEQIDFSKIDRFCEFASDIKYIDDLYEITLKDKRVIKTKSLLIASGAYSKLYAHFFDLYIDLKNLSDENEDVIGIDLEKTNQIKAGSYLSKEIDLEMEPFYLVIDGNKILYYKDQKNINHLTVATVTTIGPNESFDAEAFSKIFKKYKTLTHLPLGEMSEYKFTCGLRHKGPRRLLIARDFSETKYKNLYLINGLYKNGFTLSFLAAKKIMNLMAI